MSGAARTRTKPGLPPDPSKPSMDASSSSGLVLVDRVVARGARRSFLDGIDVGSKVNAEAIADVVLEFHHALRKLVELGGWRFDLEVSEGHSERVLGASSTVLRWQCGRSASRLILEYTRSGVSFHFGHGSIVLASSFATSQTAPHWSVRRTAAPMADHASIVAGAGWPNVLCLPTEITAIRGWTATTNDAVDA